MLVDGIEAQFVYTIKIIRVGHIAKQFSRVHTFVILRTNTDLKLLEDSDGNVEFLKNFVAKSKGTFEKSLSLSLRL